jgi:hypothetical protein
VRRLRISDGFDRPGVDQSGSKHAPFQQFKPLTQDREFIQ